MRVFLVDTSFLDIWYSPRTVKKYSYHWERQHVDNTIYRHDNAPHIRWKNIPTYPKHFHLETEYNVIESYISDIPEEAVMMFMSFVRAKLIKDDGY